MNNSTQLTLQLEMLWWIFTAIVLIAVLFPILSASRSYYFLTFNVSFIVVFITFTRYIFLLRHTFLAYRQVIKLVLIFLCIPLFVYLLEGVHAFQFYVDENGFEEILKGVPFKKRLGLGRYIQTEMLFFGTASLIVTVLFPLRLIMSVWRNRNRGTA